MKTKVKAQSRDLKIQYVPIGTLRPHEENPRRWTKEAIAQLRESIKIHGFIDPIIANAAPGREGIILGGHFRHKIAKELGMKEVPVVYLMVPDRNQERDILIRMNKAIGEFDLDLLANFDEAFLKDVGFSSEEMDEIFGIDETPEQFDLAKELKKLEIAKIEVQKGDRWQLGDHYLYCGDSTVEAHVAALMGKEKADMVMTDPPYRLEYLRGKQRDGKSTTGFGMKKNRRYLETESLPEDFTRLWVDNVAKVQAKDFSIIVYENWKNIREVWGEIERHWKVRNMLVWYLPDRNQGYAAHHKFFSKHDIAMVGSSDGKELNLNDEGELLRNEYETAFFAISGNPHWEGYAKGKAYCPTDHITCNAADEKSSGQAVIFGVKPVELLIPFIKVLTKRSDIVLEPFGGSGSTLIACERLKRRCFLMEKVPTYAQIIIRRWEKLTGNRANIIHHGNEQ